MKAWIAIGITAASRSVSNTAPRLGWLVYDPGGNLAGFVDAGQAGQAGLYEYFPRGSVTILAALHVTPAQWRQAKRSQIVRGYGD
jgi:hypothetical protein